MIVLVNLFIYFKEQNAALDQLPYTVGTKAFLIPVLPPPSSGSRHAALHLAAKSSLHGVATSCQGLL